MQDHEDSLVKKNADAEYAALALHMLDVAVESNDAGLIAERAGLLRALTSDMGMRRVASLASALEARARLKGAAEAEERPSLKDIVDEIHAIYARLGGQS